jgi:hypothetical protein
MSHIIPSEDLKNTSDLSSKLDMYHSLMTSEQQIRDGKVKDARESLVNVRNRIKAACPFYEYSEI